MRCNRGRASPFCLDLRVELLLEHTLQGENKEKCDGVGMASMAVWLSATTEIGRSLCLTTNNQTVRVLSSASEQWNTLCFRNR